MQHSTNVNVNHLVVACKTSRASAGGQVGPTKRVHIVGLSEALCSLGGPNECRLHYVSTMGMSLASSKSSVTHFNS